MENIALCVGEKVVGLVRKLREQNRHKEADETFIEYQNELKIAEEKARRYGILGFEIYPIQMERWFQNKNRMLGYVLPVVK